MKGLNLLDDAMVTQAKADIDEALPYYDQSSAKHEYLSGNEITLIDSFHLLNGPALQAFGYSKPFAKCSNVK